MAQALRTVCLEPVEHINEELTPQLRPGARRRSPAVARPEPWLLCVTSVFVVIIVFLLIGYVGAQARIAGYAFERQQLTAGLRQLNMEEAQLQVEIAGLNNASRIDSIASANNLEIPNTDRVNYIQDTSDFPRAMVAHAATTSEKPGLIARAGRELVASLDTVLYRIGRSPASPAYAQD